MIEIILHTLGFCGENHPKLVDFIPFYTYIIEYINIQRLPIRLIIPGTFNNSMC